MPKTTHRLTAVSVTNITKRGLHADGAGLYLKVGPTGAKSWVFRFMQSGKPRYLGLGSALTVKLAEARGLAGKARQQLQQGLDPIQARKQAVAAARAATANSVSFEQFAEGVVDNLEAGWKNAKHKQQWRNTLKTYVYPKLGRRPVASITTDDVLNVLKPIWTKRPETASRVRGRIETILDAASALGARSGENPARWRGNLKHLLPKQGKLKRGHHHALPWSELPAFMQRLRALTSISARALEWTILTVARTCETTGAMRTEANKKAKVWVVPPERMKAEREHRVPLTPRSIEILEEMEQLGSEWIFPGASLHGPLSSAAMAECLKGLDVNATVHGFRSTFRDWIGEATSFPEVIAEAALAHVIGDKTEQAYRRGDALERRRKMMAAWERYCLGKTKAVALGGELEKESALSHAMAKVNDCKAG